MIASKNKSGRMGDMMHIAKLSGIKVDIFEGTSMDLGVDLRKALFSLCAISNRAGKFKYIKGLILSDLLPNGEFAARKLSGRESTSVC